MLSYLYNAGLHATYDALKNESNNMDFQMDEPGAAQRYHGLLEKKWTSVIRLQKKVSDYLLSQVLLHTSLSLTGQTRAVKTRLFRLWISKPGMPL